MLPPRWCPIALLVVVIGCTSRPESDNAPRKEGTPDAAEKVVRSVLAEHFKVAPAAVAMDRPISDPPLKADDLDLVEIIMDLEDRQGVEISDQAIERYEGEKIGKGPVRITPNQLAKIVREAPQLKPAGRKK